MDLEKIRQIIQEIDTLQAWISEKEKELMEAVGQLRGVEPQKAKVSESPPKPVRKSGRIRGSRRLRYRKHRTRRGTENVREWRYVSGNYRSFAYNMKIGTLFKGGVWLTAEEARAVARLAVDHVSLSRAQSAVGNLEDWYRSFSREG